jgi:hypothetical protein
MTRLRGIALLWNDEANIEGRFESFAAYPFAEPMAVCRARPRRLDDQIAAFAHGLAAAPRLRPTRRR